MCFLQLGCEAGFIREGVTVPLVKQQQHCNFSARELCQS
jgi:hypothetical protein